MKGNEENKINYEDDPLGSAPNLFSIPKKHSFEVPEGYFEKLPLKIQEKMQSNHTSLWEKLLGILVKPQMAFSALLILIIMVVGINYFTQRDSESEKVVALVKTENKEIKDTQDSGYDSQIVPEELNLQQIEQIDQEMIVEEIDDDLIFEEEKIETKEDQVALKNESEEMDFLIDNNIDVSLIIDELQVD